MIVVNKILFTIFTLVFLSSVFRLVDGQCYQLLYEQYYCKDPTLEPDAELYFAKYLNGTDTYMEAMNLFQSLFYDMSYCYTQQCYCERYYYKPDENNDALFLKSYHYLEDLTTILTGLSQRYNKYHNVSLSNYPSIDILYGSQTLHQFCFKFEFSREAIYTYEETNVCEFQYLVARDDCSHLNLILNVGDRILTSTIRRQFDSYLMCLASGLDSASCPLETKRFYLYVVLNNKPSGFLKGGLLNYIDTIINATANWAPDPWDATTMWITGGMHLNSVQQSLETCSFTYQQTCFKTQYIEILCTGGKTMDDQSIYMLKEISITFSRVNETINYAANQTMFPKSFDNDSPVANFTGSDDRIWLQMFVYVNYLLIVDVYTNTYIIVGNWATYYFLIVQAAISPFQTRGILFDGCPSYYAGSIKSPNVLDTYEQELCFNKTRQNQSSNILSTDLYRSCLMDVTSGGNYSIADMYMVTLQAGAFLNSFKMPFDQNKGVTVTSTSTRLIIFPLKYTIFHLIILLIFTL